MSDGLLDELEFDQKIAGLNDRELMEFTARQVFAMTKMCHNHGDRITALEGRGSGLKAAGGFGGVVGGTIAGLVYGLITLIKGQQ